MLSDSLVKPNALVRPNALAVFGSVDAELARAQRRLGRDPLLIEQGAQPDDPGERRDLAGNRARLMGGVVALRQQHAGGDREHRDRQQNGDEQASGDPRLPCPAPSPQRRADACTMLAIVGVAGCIGDERRPPHKMRPRATKIIVGGASSSLRPAASYSVAGKGASADVELAPALVVALRAPASVLLLLSRRREVLAPIQPVGVR